MLSTLRNAFVCILLCAVSVIGVPKRGIEPWSLILCKFGDSNFEPCAASWFREWMLGRENGDSMESFFASISNGVYSIEGSNVTHWLKMPWSRRHIWTFSQADANLQTADEKPFALFDKAKQMCLRFAHQNGFGTHRRKITVVNEEQTAVYGRNTGVLLTPNLIFSSVLAHEMMHSMNLGHSYSDRTVRIFPYATTGEYDDKYDLMSTANAHMRPSTFGLAGPGLNGPHLDYLGWLPMNRILYFGRDGRQNYTLRLSSLSIPHSKTKGWLLLLIPYDRDDPLNVYTVEFRTPDEHDLGIAQPGIVIHRVQKIGDHYFSFLITHAHHEFDELTPSTEFVQFLQLSSNGVFQTLRLRVERINTRARFADLHVESTFDPEACIAGELSKKLTAEHPLNKKRLHHICVFAHSTTVSSSDFERQHRRNRFFELRRSFGQNECIDGYEWRALDAYDFVCVPAHRARQLRLLTLNSTRNSSCTNNGRIKRAAFPADLACVTEDEHRRVQRENAENIMHLRNPRFFNGVDLISL